MGTEPAKCDLLQRDELKRRRERKGLTLEAAARAAGFKSRQHWYEIESGRAASITLATLEKLARALECDPRDLLPKRAREGSRPGKSSARALAPAAAGV